MFTNDDAGCNESVIRGIAVALITRDLLSNHVFCVAIAPYALLGLLIYTRPPRVLKHGDRMAMCKGNKLIDIGVDRNTAIYPDAPLAV